MGITGLLPLLKDIQSKTHISNFKGQKVGIDTYCWLHKGTYGCAKDLILGKQNMAYVTYVMKRVRMLLSYGVIPVLVFDGGHLPAKAEKEKERRERRSTYKAKGFAALREGNNQEAFEHFQKACDVTPAMANDVIVQCEALNVQCIVAPYEADAQLAYLMKESITQLTISEDSDLLLYGCNKVLYKMTSDGEGQLVDMDNLHRVRTVQLSSFTFDKFRQMCMLSGCDYLPSIKGMGLKKAFKALKKHSDAYQCLRFLKCAFTVPKDYEENFRKAEIVFKYQLVFDPRKKKIIRLSSIEGVTLHDDDLKYAGPDIDSNRALDIALGNIDPIKGDRFANRTDFVSGGNASIQKNANTAFQYAKKNTNSLQATPTISQEQREDSPTTIESSDLTPTNHDALSHEAPISKVLFRNPQVDATKSLKLLEKEESTEVQVDRLRDLYTEKNITNYHNVISKTITESKGSTLPKKKIILRKFKNPFRKQEDSEDSPKVPVFSRYFGGTVTDDSLITEDRSPLKEPLSFSDKDSKSFSVEKSNKHNRSLIGFLDGTDVSMSSIPKRRLTSSPEPVRKHRKLNSNPQLNIKNMMSKKPKLNATRSKIQESNLQEKINPENKKETRVVLSSIDTNKETVDFEITEREVNDIVISDSDKSCLENQKIVIISPKKEDVRNKFLEFQNKGKLKIGLSKNTSKDKSKNSKISENLDRLNSQTSDTEINAINKNPNDEVELIYSDEEEVLPKLPKLPCMDLDQFKSTKRQEARGSQSKIGKCRPIGLSKKHKTSLLKQTSSKQLTLDTFRFKKKASVL